MSTIKKLDVLQNVIHVEYEEKSLVHIQVIRGDRTEFFTETPICMGMCPKCNSVFSVFFKKSQLHCPDCKEKVQGCWTTALVNTWGKP